MSEIDISVVRLKSIRDYLTLIVSQTLLEIQSTGNRPLLKVHPINHLPHC
jgi:hypothetical protein